MEPVTYVNGKRFVLPQGRGETTLLQFLRENGLSGTKLGCGEGGCGACTVMVSHWDQSKVVHRSVNACLCPLYAVEGMQVVTCEGIGNIRDGLHPVQMVLARSHGSQCGFCTPGFVMSMYTLLRNSEEAPSEEEVEDALGGNLCRCTGYRPILDAFKTFAKTDPKSYTDEAIHAATNGVNGSAQPKANYAFSSSSVCPSSGLPCDCKANGGGCGTGAAAGTSCGKVGFGVVPPGTAATAEPIFPAELKKRAPFSLHMPGAILDWYRPTSLDQLLELKEQFPAAKLVVGSTEVGIEMKFKDCKYPVIVAPTHVPELNQITVTDKGVEVGASVTLTRLLHVLKDLIDTRPAHETSTFQAVVHQLRWFAGTQIRNVSSLGGNICTGSPISDLNPIWMASGTVFTAVGKGTGERDVPASEFFLGYRQIDLKPHEVLYRVTIPFTRQYEYVKEFKQSPRREDDIAIVNAGMRVKLGQDAAGTWVVEEAAIAFGGVAAKAIMAPKLAAALLGKPWEQATCEAALEAVSQDVVISDNAPGGKVEYRRSLAASFVFKYFVHVALALEADSQKAYTSNIPAEQRSAAKPYERPPAKGVQFSATAPPMDVVGHPHQHMAADLQVCGEATYCDDVKMSADALYAVCVTSTKPHAKIIKLDASKALEVPGVAGFYSRKDVPGSNKIGPIVQDEDVYADGIVTCVGQVIGTIVADTEAIARRAAKLVVVEYEELPAIMSCEEAIEAGSFYDYSNFLASGDVEAALDGGECDHVIEGTYKVGGQEHFYLETNACLVIPHENDEFELISSSQTPAKHQVAISSVLSIPAHKIVSKVKRLGGGFGGKETRAIFLHAAIAVPAYHLKRPVRMMLDRDEDMQMTGHRHAFLAKYRVGFSKDGVIKAVDMQLFSNAGNSWDLSGSVMDRALMHSDCCYRVPNFRVRGKVCRTNQASNTAFRGFGAPQGMMFAEMFVDEVARCVGRPVHEIRELNMQKEGDITHYTMKLEDCKLDSVWNQVKSTSGYEARLAAAKAFNDENRYRKKGIAIVPTKFGISFTTKFLNQAGALVHVYLDGTVLVTHGGVEMGQGLHTKMAQVAAQALGIKLSDVFISETSTDKVPNASPTAASASSDLYGAAVLDACRQIKERLAPFREKLGPEKTFKEVVNMAYVNQIDLSAHGFYIVGDITGFGGNRPFNYLCYGASVSEVELDTLTGDFQILRTDIVMDVGNPINPAIDIGQVEGGFMQGMGWLCLEELQWGDKQHSWVRPGHLFTKGPGTYKIPSANDIPIDFRVELLADAPNCRAIHSSKAVGEPPFHLGASVFFALKDAVYAARKDAGLGEGHFILDAPATPERLRMLCADYLTAKFAAPDIRPNISC